ncbi:regulatory helix-turn-helix protein, lysR family [Streptomyces sp. Ncost-T10-10d]|nr:regulatory helix-turn-helix protein, lysR family [Streptomyces sp. Ncost-T10-10d]
MELRTLRYFVTVAEELHFGRAAARLHMSQPPLSRAIKQLETEIGALLFARSPAGVMLTPVGAVLLDEARALFDQADRVRIRVTAAAGAATVTIGIVGDGTDPGITRLAAVFRRSHPGVDIRIRDADLTDPTCGLRVVRGGKRLVRNRHNSVLRNGAVACMSGVVGDEVAIRGNVAHMECPARADAVSWPTSLSKKSLKLSM